MNKAIVVAGALLVATLPPAALAVDGLALARSSVCMGCHKVDGRMVGPPLREVAARYRVTEDRDGAAQYLAQAIREGGRGRWGAIPMPAQPQVSATEAQQLAEWILSLEPAS